MDRETLFHGIFLSHNYVLTMVNYVLIVFNRVTCIYLPGTQQYLTYLPTYLNRIHIHSLLLLIIYNTY
jgi:hypothetical protein